MVVQCIIVFFKNNGERMVVFTKSGVFDYLAGDYGSNEMLETSLIDSFVDCPSTINGEGIRRHLSGDLCCKNFKNVYFDDLLIHDDMCQSGKHLYLKRYFLCLALF